MNSVAASYTLELTCASCRSRVVFVKGEGYKSPCQFSCDSPKHAHARCPNCSPAERAACVYLDVRVVE